MIYIDATEGVAGDMLLAGMIGLLDDEDRRDFLIRFRQAAAGEGVGFSVLEVEDAGETGISVVYSRSRTVEHESTFSECSGRIGVIGDFLGGGQEASSKILGLLFEAEAEAHGLSKEKVHLHEIGRPEAMLNIAGIGRLTQLLLNRGAGKIVCSTISTGKGTTVIGHGAVKIPPPASAILLRGLRHLPGESPGERATPTGIAAVKALADSQSEIAPEDYQRRSVGFGSKRFAGRLGRTILTWL